MPGDMIPPSESVGRLAALGRSFRHRNFRLYFLGQMISLVGTWMQGVALSWLVYRLTGSSLDLGLLGFTSQLPMFLLPLLGGALADRLDRRRILVGTQAASMIQAGVLAALTLTGHVEVWHLYALAALLGCINALDMPTRQSFVIELVVKEDLHNAIALNSSVFNAARVVGPSVAGILVAAIGEGWCFLVNALSFVAVILGLLAIRLPRRTPAKSPVSLLANMLEGCRFAWSTPFVRSALLLLGTGSMLGVSYATLMPVFAGEVLHSGARGLGILLASAGVGSLAAALTLAARRGGAGLEKLVLGAAGGFGVSLLLFSLSRNFTLSALLLAPVGYSMIVFMAGTNTLLQLRTPDALRGRVMSLFSMMLIGMAPFGSLLAGALAHLLGTPPAVGLCGAAILVVTAVFGRHMLRVDA